MSLFDEIYEPAVEMNAAEIEVNEITPVITEEPNTVALVEGTHDVDCIEGVTAFETVEMPEDVRTEVQKKLKKQISYDVGEKVGGARKDVNEIRKQFLQTPDKSTLACIAELDEVLAFELATKKNIFSWFDMATAQSEGVEIRAAYAIHLLIRRIPSTSKGLNAENYTKSLFFISDELKRVRTYQQFTSTFGRFEILTSDANILERWLQRLEAVETKLKVIYEQSSSVDFTNDETMKKYISDNLLEFRKLKGIIHTIEIQDQFGLKQLGTFTELLASYKKRNAFRKATDKFHSWSVYIEEHQPIAKSEDELSSIDNSNKAPAKRQSVWERALPFEPKRIGGLQIEDIDTPEGFIDYFGFRGAEYGNTVSDIIAKGHIVNCSRALVDLADVLSISPKDLTQNRTLAMAFGARGSGTALAHYEPKRHVINLTKKKGSLGVLAHEWWHSFDRFMNQEFTGGANYDLLTEGLSLNIDNVPYEVRDAYYTLMSAIKDGYSTEKFRIDPSNKRSISTASYNSYYEHNGNLQDFVDERMKKFDEYRKSIINSYLTETSRDREQKRYIRSRKLELNKACHVAAQIHFEITGEQLIDIPYTVDHSEYYSTARQLDGPKRKPYYSSNVELTARAFEAYVHSKLQERGMRNDYLVCGIDNIYPQGKELACINYAMENFLNHTIPYLVSSAE